MSSGKKGDTLQTGAELFIREGKRISSKKNILREKVYFQRLKRLWVNLIYT